MKPLAAIFQNLPQVLKPMDENTSIGTVLGRIGSGRPLMVSAGLADLRPVDTEHRLVAALEQCSGRSPRLHTRTYFPNEGPAYSLVETVRWDCPHDKLPEVVSILEGAFKAAPADRIANELYKLRMLTAGRDQKDASDQEAENVIWLEQLRCYPGDIVIDVLRSWTKPGNPQGKWWPTWNDIAERLQRACDRRQALLNFVRQLAERPAPTLAIADQPPSAEQRAAAVEHYKQTIRPELQAWRDEAAKQKAQETPEQALDRLMAEKDQPVALGGELLKKIEQIKTGA
jgi:hypothetical protein